MLLNSEKKQQGKNSGDETLGFDLVFLGQINTELTFSFCYLLTVFNKSIFRRELTQLYETLSCHLNFCRVIRIIRKIGCFMWK